MAQAYKTTYFDPAGKAKTGYIIDGKTYKDEGGNERIENGSVVETKDGLYTLTSSGGIKNDYAAKAFGNTENTIKDMKKSARRLNDSLYNSKKALIENQKKEVNKSYEREARNEYLKSMASQKNLYQLLKAGGMNGGMSESGALQAQLAYENAVNDLKDKRASELSELDAKLLSLRNETDYNTATQNSEYDKLYLEYADKNLDRLLNSLSNERKNSTQSYFDLLNYGLDKDTLDWDIAESWRDYSRRAYEFDEEAEQKKEELAAKERLQNAELASKEKLQNAELKQREQEEANENERFWAKLRK